jgi:hypothetical protein
MLGFSVTIVNLQSPRNIASCCVRLHRIKVVPLDIAVAPEWYFPSKQSHAPLCIAGIGSLPSTGNDSLEKPVR